MKVLAKAELDSSIILNEFSLIMENFGIPQIESEDEFENDFLADSEEEIKNKDQDKDNKENKENKFKNPIVIDFEILDEKGLKILKKLARFLLERYMHPREFFGPTIKKEELGKKKCKVEVIKHADFYLRLKLASIRKKLT